MSGIIIVDTCEVSSLRTRTSGGPPPKPLANALVDTQPTQRYFDLLVGLGMQGWQIVFPEMVSLEFCRILADGTDLDQIDRITKIFHADALKQKAFLNKVRQGVFPGCSMAPVARDNMTEYGLFMQKLHRLLENYSHHTHANNVNLVRELQAEVHDCLREAEGKDFGEFHAFDIIEEIVLQQRRQQARTPIFFLSSDYNARIHLRDLVQAWRMPYDADINLLTTSGLILGLENSTATSLRGEHTNALEEMGFNGNGKKHWDLICKGHPEFPAYNSSRDHYHDAPVETYETELMPFAQEIAPLAQRMADARVPYIAQEKINPAKDRVARFEAQLRAREARHASGNNR